MSRPFFSLTGVDLGCCVRPKRSRAVQARFVLYRVERSSRHSRGAFSPIPLNFCFCIPPFKVPFQLLPLLTGLARIYCHDTQEITIISLRITRTTLGQYFRRTTVPKTIYLTDPLLSDIMKRDGHRLDRVLFGAVGWAMARQIHGVIWDPIPRLWSSAILPRGMGTDAPVQNKPGAKSCAAQGDGNILLLNSRIRA